VEGCRRHERLVENVNAIVSVPSEGNVEISPSVLSSLCGRGVL